MTDQEGAKGTHRETDIKCRKLPTAGAPPWHEGMRPNLLQWGATHLSTIQPVNTRKGLILYLPNSVLFYMAEKPMGAFLIRPRTSKRRVTGAGR